MDDLSPGAGESLDRLAGEWRIFQLIRGHRFSTDDLATAWRAAAAYPSAQRLLDLGCGIGSVGLSLLWRLGEVGNDRATLLGVEAQEESAGLARRSVRVNGLEDRVRIVQGDLRETPIDGLFDLITGSPPYVPIGHGVISPVPQRAAARIELRGSVYDYCRVAREHLAPGGRFCFVMAAADPRTEDAPRQHGLRVVERYDFVFAPGRDPHIATLVCAREEDGASPDRVEGRLVVRGDDGRWTERYLRFRAEMGAPSL